MITEPIQQGNQIRLSAEFKNETGAIEDPTFVEGQIQPPTGTVEKVSVSREDVGSYFYILTVGLPGRWKFRFAGVGTLVAAAESEFWVQNSDLV
jgi:hypothetical protein